MPKPSPHALPWQPTPRWAEPGAFWDEPIGAPELAAMSTKYASLLRLIGAPAGSVRDRGLRELAARWPGALREGQLVSAAVLERRHAAVGGEIDGPRRAWREAGLAAVPLWTELHGLLGDLARIRAERRVPGDLPDALGPDARARWPATAGWWAQVPWPLDARLARAWLAAVAGYAPVELDRLLRT